jgi:predicted Zn-dependent protease
LWRWWDRLHKGEDVKGKDNRFDWEILAYRNLAARSHWLQLQLAGAPGNPEAIGAQVTLATKSGREARQVGTDEGSYLSQGHYRLYFGLGDDKGPVSLEIRWPDGTRQALQDISVDQRLTIKQPG